MLCKELRKESLSRGVTVYKRKIIEDCTKFFLNARYQINSAVSANQDHRYL
jgi:hypothetical protein